ncbi:L-type lectin-domain containing receptor kinase IV.1-like [Pyrus ussuriensis x Pyrus communis]|uniref:non-specific serine/threonine protein kinase n=1 Tax=Pyrus ussuriensis x Pyrus communis TaxID=2448454 RepID=A0A5N5HSW1_9ROSA|nr:L-type lectin-domain containing receptor kinase IV.1-like [Pyrus ussuriensis x Pyrus communis]
MAATFFKLVILIQATLAAAQNVSFIYNGFRSEYLSLDGVAQFTPNGLLMLTNDSQEKSHAFYPNPVTFKNSYSDTNVFSFSTTFVFAIRSAYAALSGHGMAFVISPTRGIPGVFPPQYMGLCNNTNNNETNCVFAVELDTIWNNELGDINNNHVGIDINGLRSEKSAPAGYYAQNNGGFRNLTLISGQPMQVWVEYDDAKKKIDVTLAPIVVDKPQIPLLSLKRDLSMVLNKTMYVGFSSSTGSFATNGQAQEIVLSQLPKLPRIGGKKRSNLVAIGVPVISVSLVLLAISGLIYGIRRRKKFAELLEDWELEYGPQRFKYKELYIATKGFKEKEVLGTGGFGKVYRGILPSSKTEIAVKRVSHDSRQGMKEFVAEIASIGRLRHRNLVRKGELLLVYDYMPNGSLDKYLFDQPVVTLNWKQRFRVIRGVASGLFYLHEGWEQVVVHRDVKASNVLLDEELNGRLGDFGLARLYDHGKDPQTTRVVGTLGYLAPEHTRTGKATTQADVFSFGAFLLEVACGRRPIGTQGQDREIILVDWVYSCWKRARPSMRQVVQYLEGDIPLLELPLDCLSARDLTFAHHEGFDDFVKSYASSTSKGISYVPEPTLLSGGR